MKEKDLAEIVVEWEHWDDEVAKKGWDGGERDERWDNAKTAMVSLAHEIIDGMEQKPEECEAKLFHGYGQGGIGGMGFKIRPACKNESGYMEARMIKQDGADVDENALSPMRLHLEDLGYVLDVLKGREEGISLTRKSETFPVQRTFIVTHGVKEDEPVFKFRMITEIGSMEFEKAKRLEVSYAMSSHQATALESLIGHAILLVGFGLPSNMKKAGE